jgi:O-antigen ligase
LILHRRPVIWTATTTWLAIFALGATCSVLLAADRGAAARPYVTFVTEGLVMFVLLTNVVRSWQVLRLIIVSVVLVGAGLGLMSLIANAQHRDWTSFGGFAQVSEGSVANASDWRTWQEWKASPLRASGPIGDPNFYALILSLLLPLAAYLIVTSRSRLGKLGALGALVLIGAGIVLTSSRGAAVAIAVVVTVLSVFGILPRRTLIYLFVAAFVLLTAVPSYRERLSDVVVGKGLIDTSSSQSTDASALGRYSELIAAGRVFAAHPVVGVSLGQFGSYYPRYSSDLGISVHEGARDAHNLYLGLGAEVGLVGLVSFLGIVVTLIRGLLRTRSRWRRERPDIVALAVALLASIGLLLANGVFLHIAYMRYMWFVFALAAIAVNLGRMQRPAPPPALPALAPSIERERPPSRATRVVTNASRS